MEHVIEFGLFTGKFLIAFIFIAGLFLLLFALIAKQKLKPDLQVENYNEKIDELKSILQSVVLSKKELKKALKDKKLKDKQHGESLERLKHIFYMHFEGDIKASAVDQLRDEITAILLVAHAGDEVVLSIESPGGTVHGYGLAAAQILRLKKAGLTVTASVDRVAASGGYMMACTANKIIAAPFAIIGSIGVLAQVPNFHRLLQKHHVDYEEISSGEYKRTVSVLGEITDKGRKKFTEQISDTHTLFKEFVKRERPLVDINDVATGEYWFAVRAHELKLVDEILTTDEYLLSQKDKAQIYSIKYAEKKKLSDKINDLVGTAADRIWSKFTEWSASSRQL